MKRIVLISFKNLFQRLLLLFLHSKLNFLSTSSTLIAANPYKAIIETFLIELRNELVVAFEIKYSKVIHVCPLKYVSFIKSTQTYGNLCWRFSGFLSQIVAVY